MTDDHLCISQFLFLKSLTVIYFNFSIGILMTSVRIILWLLQMIYDVTNLFSTNKLKLKYTVPYFLFL